MYSSKNIKVLKGMEAIRKNYGMYVGDIKDTVDGPITIVREVLDNAMDEVLNGHGDRVAFIRHKNNVFTIIDNGRGIPSEPYEDTGKSTVEILCTELHAGGKFDTDTSDSAYKSTSGTHGIGLSAVNALSSTFQVSKVEPSGEVHKYIFENGILKNILKYASYEEFTEKSEFAKMLPRVFEEWKRGTMVTIAADVNFYATGAISEKQCHELLFNISQIAKADVYFVNEESDEVKFYKAGTPSNWLRVKNKGVAEFLEETFTEASIEMGELETQKSKESQIGISFALAWSKETPISAGFTNSVYQKDGGSHVLGLNKGIRDAVTASFSNKSILNKLTNTHLVGEVDKKDIMKNLGYVISVQVLRPVFQGQTKTKTIMPRIVEPVRSFVFKTMENFFLTSEGVTTLERILSETAKRKSIERIKNIDTDDKFSVGGSDSTFIRAPRWDTSKNILVIAEGTSAAGSIRGIDPHVSILLALGKLANSYKHNFIEFLDTKFLSGMMKCFKLKFQENGSLQYSNDFQKIIILADADDDGDHICSLILGVFYKYFKDLIIDGYLYVANPPLFRCSYGSKNSYFNSFRDMFEFMLTQFVKDEKRLKELKSLDEKRFTYFATGLKASEGLLISEIMPVLARYGGIQVTKGKNKIEINRENTEEMTKRLKSSNFRVSYSEEKGKLPTYIFEEKRSKKRFEVNSKTLQKSNIGTPLLDVYKGIHDRTDKEIERCIAFYSDLSIFLEKSKLTRFKGLGEMGRRDMEEGVFEKGSCFHKVTVDDIDKTNQTFIMFLGEETDGRKREIEETKLGL